MASRPIGSAKANPSALQRWLVVLVLLGTVAASEAQAPGAQTALAPRPDWPLYQATGEQFRVYEFPETGEPIPYRLSVPPSWTPDQRLPVLVSLRAGTSINNNHRGDNDLVREANARGYIVVSPLGYRGLPQPYYGSPYPVDRPGGPSVPAAGWSEEENRRAEQDVLHVVNLVLAEYGADADRVYLHGQNPSASGALHLAVSYPQRFRALVLSSGPIVTEDFPFATVRDAGTAVLVLHGDQDTSNALAASQRMAEEFTAQGIRTEFRKVPGGQHLDAYLKDAAGIFDFLDRQGAADD